MPIRRPLLAGAMLAVTLTPATAADRAKATLDCKTAPSAEFAYDCTLDLANARTGAHVDGATFILREGNSVRYVAEDAIAPLWKGQRFPIERCISGWSMLRAQPVVLEDVATDARIPHSVYRPTFVQSLAMVPIGPGTPVASIGVYWAHRHTASAYELELLESRADEDLARRVKELLATLDAE